jgi:hypothetical protein
MHGRVYELSRIVLSQQQHVVIFLLALLGGLLCTGLTAEAKSDYEIINTGITGGGCWVDDNHFIVIKGHQSAPGQEFEVEGLYYLDPNHPRDLKRVDLSPIEPTTQRSIKDVSCQGETILFFIKAPDRKTSRLYGLKIGQQPELIADMRWAKPSVVSLKGQYVLGNKLTVDKGVWEEQTDCDVKFLKSGFKALCWLRDTIGLWVTPQFVAHEYLWRESILIRDQNGTDRRILNPSLPLKLSDGTELKQGYLLRDLENRVVTQVKMEQPPYRVYRNTIKPNQQGTYLYAACSKAGDHGTRRLTVGGRICRFQLDGGNQQWTEVVAVQQSPQDPLSIQHLDINQRGDVVAWEPAHGGASIFWKYSAQTHRVEKVRHAPTIADLGGPQLSPTGRWISFLERQTLYLAHDKGVRS